MPKKGQTKLGMNSIIESRVVSNQDSEKNFWVEICFESKFWRLFDCGPFDQIPEIHFKSWVDLNQIIVSHKLSRIKTFGDWVESNLFFSRTHVWLQIRQQLMFADWALSNRRGNMQNPEPTINIRCGSDILIKAPTFQCLLIIVISPTARSLTLKAHQSYQTAYLCRLMLQCAFRCLFSWRARNAMAQFWRHEHDIWCTATSP